jgi:hypothetical protein
VNHWFAQTPAALALLAAIALVTLTLLGVVRAEPQTTTFRDSMGRETGRAERSGNGTTFYDNLGRETGRANRLPMPTTCAIAQYCLGSDGKWRSW